MKKKIITIIIALILMFGMAASIVKACCNYEFPGYRLAEYLCVSVDEELVYEFCLYIREEQME